MKARFVRRPEPVEAIRWTGDNIEAVHEFMAPTKPRYMEGFPNADDLIGTPGGVANKGDYIVRRIDGPEIWPLTQTEFEARYQAEPTLYSADEVREAVREAWFAGFAESGEGFNGEYPFDGDVEAIAAHAGNRECADKYVDAAFPASTSEEAGRG